VAADTLGNSGIDGKIILKQIFRKQGIKIR
jgi:hypothetical protein